MNRITDLLTEAGFVRTEQPINYPIIVHAVPGAGKTTLLRTIAKLEGVSVYTLTDAVHSDIGGQLIKKFEGKVEGKINILDEYLFRDTDISAFDLVLSDPFQSPIRPKFRAHFIKNRSFRFGEEIATYLRGIGFDVQGNQEVKSEVKVSGLFEGEVRGKVIVLDQLVQDLLIKHNSVGSFPCEVAGLEFEEVTVLSSESALNANSQNSSSVFIALTRASKTLNVLLNK
ncbi:TGB1 [Garlic common virus]|nr:TGB1 [Garlic common virus]QED43075.1 TGB1 [Garlic common virus]QED43080.1 TGB1 [Garlic common virus]QED43085.1 TGB1 [Garlic common virus]